MFHYGVRDIAIQWLKGYLAVRVLHEINHGFESNNNENVSMLKLLLFFSMDDLATVSEACLSIIFADDLHMFMPGETI